MDKLVNIFTNVHDDYNNDPLFLEDTKIEGKYVRRILQDNYSKHRKNLFEYSYKIGSLVLWFFKKRVN